MSKWTGWVAALWVVTSAMAQDPTATIKGYSDFRQIDLSRLGGGEILSARGALMKFRNGIAGQTCFAVAAPAPEVARHLQTWDPAPYADLKVYADHALHVPCDSTDFCQLDFHPNEYPIRWLLEQTAVTTPARSALNVSRAEAARLAACPQKPAGCWAQLLCDRASAFQQKGLAGVQPYEVAGDTVAPAYQLRTMLLEHIAVSREFEPLLRAMGLLGSEPVRSLVPFYYWTLFEADHHATLNLGAVYLLPAGAHYQLADVQYYVSNDYYASITLYEVWPIQVGGQAGSLVWRGDYFAAPSLAFTKGTERIAYGALMLQDIKKEIRDFREDLRKNR